MIIGDASSGSVYEFPCDSEDFWKNAASNVIETTRCATCKVYHALNAPHECAPQIEEPKS